MGIFSCKKQINPSEPKTYTKYEVNQAVFDYVDDLDLNSKTLDPKLYKIRDSGEVIFSIYLKELIPTGINWTRFSAVFLYLELGVHAEKELLIEDLTMDNFREKIFEYFIPHKGDVEELGKSLEKSWRQEFDNLELFQAYNNEQEMFCPVMKFIDNTISSWEQEHYKVKYKVVEKNSLRRAERVSSIYEFLKDKQKGFDFECYPKPTLENIFGIK